MINENIKQIIEEHLFFKGFEYNEIDILIKHCAFTSFKKGDFLLGARQEAKNFYLITNGIVSLQVFSHSHGIIKLENIQDGEFLGWSWLTAPYDYHFDAVAFSKIKALVFDAKAIKRDMEANHEFGYKMYRLFIPIIVERLQAARKNILELYERDS
ncbi:MAG: cyclic nucleotide-binding domain-containing protein [Candidatus Sericytochromatia bacterium]|nr:cyclic nucleotide-binding domain-containing protein [Candidatus Sericytochromatia bacterium]